MLEFSSAVLFALSPYLHHSLVLIHCQATNDLSDYVLFWQS